MIKLSNENFDELIHAGTHLVDFYAEWCGPCKMLAPILEQVDDKINIIKVDVDTHEGLASKYRVMSVPTLIYFKDGEKIKETSGFKTKDMLLKEIEEVNS